jgi:hypothetical protein
MPTLPDITGHLRRELTSAQWIAVDQLAAGATDADAAKAARVTRRTVNGWRNHDPVFAAALNARRVEL